MKKPRCKFCKKSATRFADIELKPNEFTESFVGAGQVLVCDEHIETMQVYLIPSNPRIEYLLS